MNIVEQICYDRGMRLAALIDSKMAIVVKPKPQWMPKFIYEALIRETVQIIQVI